MADGYEADLSYGLEFNAGMIFGYDAGATEVGSFFYLDPRAARPTGEYWPKKVQKHSGATAPQKTITRQVWQRYSPIWSWCGSSAKARSLPYKQRKCTI